MSSEEYVSSSELSQFVSRAQSVIEEYPQMNEDNTKSKILRGFLEELGWDIVFDAELEYQVTIGTSTYKVDYALSANGSSPVLFVEAKGYDTSLKEKHRDQLRSYLRQTDVDWGLLSNGQRFEIYRRENVEDGVEIRTVANIQLEQLPQSTQYVGLLTKDALESGHSREMAQRIFEIERAKDDLEERKDEIAEDVTEMLTSKIGDVVAQDTKTESKEMVDRLIERLDEQTTDIESDRSRGESFWGEVERNIGIKRTEDSVELVDGTTATEDYINFVRFMFDHSYLSPDDLPIESGNVRYILNTENAHQDGQEMYNPKEVVDGVYLEAHQNTADKKKRIVQLGDTFGVGE